MSTTNDRKSLMLDDEIYARVSAIAKKAQVARPVVIEAMLQLVDVAALENKLQQIRAQAAAQAAEEKKKREALAALAGQLDMNQINALLSKLGASV